MLNSILILIDLEASDHYFAKRILFILYILYNLLKTRIFTNRDFIFTISISEKDLVEFLTKINRTKYRVNLNNVLYIPNLYSNLIFIFKLISKDACI